MRSARHHMVALAAVIAVVSTALASSSVPARASAASRIRCSPTTRPCTLPADLAAKVAEVTGEISRRLGRALPFAPQFAFDTGRGPRGETFAEATLVDATGHETAAAEGPGPGCLITFYEGALSADEIDNTVAHELFHCFQFALDARAAPKWFEEGSAEWVGAELGGPTPSTRQNWNDWLERPAKPLFDREYDAMGFFAVLAQQGVDPWSQFDAMQRSSIRESSQGAYNLAQAALGEEPALDVAMAVTREALLGADWESRGAGIPGRHATETVRVRVTDGAVPLGARIDGLYGTASVVLRPTGDVLSLRSERTGAVAVGFVGAPPLIGTEATGDWCLLKGGCTCPDGAPPQRPLLAGAPGPVGLAFADTDSGRTTVNFTVQARKLETWCGSHELSVNASLCDLIPPADAAAALGKPAAGAGVQYKRGGPKFGYCFYPSNNETDQALSMTGTRLPNAKAAFLQREQSANGVAVSHPDVGERALLVEYGATGAELDVLVAGGVISLTASRISALPNPVPENWVDAPLAAALVSLGRTAVTHL